MVVAACVLHNWCIMEDDQDETIFQLAENCGNLETNVNDYFPAALMVGTRRANAGGNTKREMLSSIIETM